MSRQLERRLLEWAADSYFALRASGLPPEKTGRIICEVLNEKLKNPNLNLYLDRIRKDMIMRVSETYGGNTLTADDMPEDGLRATIRKVTMKTFEDNGRERDKFILYFEEIEKSLVVNMTNAQTLVAMFGDETDDWEGQRIEMFRTKVEFGGKRVPAIRIRDRKARPAAPQPTAGKKPVVTQADADELDNGDDTPF